LSEDDERRRDACGRFLPQYSPELRLRVRHDYELTDLTIEAVADKSKIAESTVLQWAQDECWVRRRPHRIDPNDLLSRMLALLDRQMIELEAAVNKGATEVAMLSKIVTTLDKVLLVKERTAGEDRPRSSKRVEELRAKIAERINELNRA
jgi:hypothetical protein